MEVTTVDQVRVWFSSYEADLERVKAFWEGEGRYLVSVYPSEHHYRQCFDDEQILAEVPLHLQAQARLPGVNPPSFYADWGTISAAKYWGGRTRFDSPVPDWTSVQPSFTIRRRR